MIFFSVILPIYKKNTISEVINCLNSILKQTLLPNEIIIIYDGYVSIDIKNIVNNKIFFFKKKIIQNAANIGLGLTLKKAVLNCTYDLVIRVDADDISVKNRFYELISAAKKNKKVDVIGSYILEKYNNHYYNRKTPCSSKNIKNFIHYKNPVNHNSVFFKKKSIVKNGNYSDVKFFEDYYLWFKIIKNKGRILNLDKILVYTNIDNNFYRRRTGYKYLKFFFIFLNLIYKKKFINTLNYLFLISLRTPIIMMPLLINRIVYQNLLRKKNDIS
jgi:hypothetical protein